RLEIAGRMHAVWALAHLYGRRAVNDLFSLIKSDPEPRVQVQAIRAIADLTDPVLVQHRLDAGPGDAEAAKKLANLGTGRDPRVIREIVVALGRLRWPEAPQWISKNLGKTDVALEHAAMQALRRSQNWGAILKLLDGNEPIRELALRSLSGIY